jgi:hypothetical protein
LTCREVQVYLACRWYCKLRIEGALLDHSAFWRARNERLREGDAGGNPERAVKSYGSYVERLIKVKRQYDPDNVFCSAIPLPVSQHTLAAE